VTEPDPENEALVVVRQGPLVAPVLSRVVGMLGARAQFPIDRLDDALLVTDTVAAHAAGFTVDSTVTMTVHAREGELELRIGLLRPDGGQGLLAAAELPGVGNVLQRVADDVQVQRDPDGEELVVRLGSTV
jgi:hypothetical protein